MSTMLIPTPSDFFRHRREVVSTSAFVYGMYDQLLLAASTSFENRRCGEELEGLRHREVVRQAFLDSRTGRRCRLSYADVPHSWPRWLGSDRARPADEAVAIALESWTRYGQLTTALTRRRDGYSSFPIDLPRR